MRTRFRRGFGFGRHNGRCRNTVQFSSIGSLEPARTCYERAMRHVTPYLCFCDLFPVERVALGNLSQFFKLLAAVSTLARDLPSGDTLCVGVGSLHVE